ncbi:MAG: patatin-like phospholipase family protein [Cyclobacteriaceae bacterium]|nr:patatin-like phospholipase family protein [Cyclobacteriaceae bacterium]MCH8515141.1 patatin-like phospholipase family protein [Cyclobacteriaceae bacterium]
MNINDLRGREIALVLSSGGARGVAHIQVIRELLNLGCHIHSIAGSSIGAVIGGMYAAGELDTYEEWVLSMDRLAVWKLVDFTLSNKGFIRGERVFSEMKKLAPDQKIEDLAINFSAVATDLYTHQEVVLNKGSLYDAMRASVAIPSLFTPVMQDGHLLVDGGVVNPIPVNCIQRRENDVLVVVDVNSPIAWEEDDEAKPQSLNTDTSDWIKFINPKYSEGIEKFTNKWSKFLKSDKDKSKKEPGYFDLINETLLAQQFKLSELTLRNFQPDVLVQFPKDSFGTFEFYRSNEILQKAKKAFYHSIEAEQVSKKKQKTS